MNLARSTTDSTFDRMFVSMLFTLYMQILIEQDGA